MHIHSFTVGPFAENTYLLSESGEALLVDPGFFEEHEMVAFREKLEERQAELKAVVLTHAHVDHVLGLSRLKDDFDVPVYRSHADNYLWDNFPAQAQRFGFEAEAFDFDTLELKAGETPQIAGISLEVRYTPGHAPDHISLYSAEHGMLLAGDALFRQGIGRTDLYKGDFSLLEQSIRNQLYTLPEDTTVYPGHGPKTTIGYEMENNPFVKG